MSTSTHGASFLVGHPPFLRLRRYTPTMIIIIRISRNSHPERKSYCSRALVRTAEDDTEEMRTESTRATSEEHISADDTPDTSVLSAVSILLILLTRRESNLIPSAVTVITESPATQSSESSSSVMTTSRSSVLVVSVTNTKRKAELSLTETAALSTEDERRSQTLLFAPHAERRAIISGIINALNNFIRAKIALEAERGQGKPNFNGGHSI